MGVLQQQVSITAGQAQKQFGFCFISSSGTWTRGFSKLFKCSDSESLSSSFTFIFLILFLKASQRCWLVCLLVRLFVEIQLLFITWSVLPHWPSPWGFTQTLLPSQPVLHLTISKIVPMSRSSFAVSYHPPSTILTPGYCLDCIVC